TTTSTSTRNRIARAAIAGLGAAATIVAPPFSPLRKTTPVLRSRPNPNARTGCAAPQFRRRRKHNPLHPQEPARAGAQRGCAAPAATTTKSSPAPPTDLKAAFGARYRQEIADSFIDPRRSSNPLWAKGVRRQR